ncbi:unnamed protein product [Owenia fusiformis]|nr:unnamed protein product [Owenia fusiformis]
MSHMTKPVQWASLDSSGWSSFGENTRRVVSNMSNETPHRSSNGDIRLPQISSGKSVASIDLSNSQRRDSNELTEHNTKTSYNVSLSFSQDKDSLGKDASSSHGLSIHASPREIQQMIKDGLELPSLVDVNPRFNEHGSSNMMRPGFPMKMHKQKTLGVKGKYDDIRPKKFNPKPLPFQSQNFQPCTMKKSVLIPRRHDSLFSGVSEYVLPRSKDVILHTERYQLERFLKHRRKLRQKIEKLMVAGNTMTQWDKIPDRLKEGMGQQDRLYHEQQQKEKIRGMKRKFGINPLHREQKDLLLGGAKASLGDRLDITNELEKYKTMVLPSSVKDPLVTSKQFLPTIDRTSTIVTSSAPQPTRVRQNSAKRKPVVSTKIKKQSDNGKSSIPFIIRKPTFLNNQKKPQRKVTIEESSSDESVPPSPSPPTPPPQPDPEPTPSPIEASPEALSEEEVDIPSPTPEPSPLPPPRSAVSRHPPKTPNPLKGADLTRSLTREATDMLMKTFKRLDTDMDGHVMFSQLKSQLPKNLTFAQQRFIKQVYDISSASTFFGLDEFLTLSVLCERISSFEDDLRECFKLLDFSELDDNIKIFIEYFQKADKSQTGRIDFEAMETIIRDLVRRDFDSETGQGRLNQVLDAINPSGSEIISKVECLAYVPYFLSQHPKYDPPDENDEDENNDDDDQQNKDDNQGSQHENG